jgi:acyl-CoA synthetase (AMP-forming)/AMP-acid ligase II
MIDNIGRFLSNRARRSPDSEAIYEPHTGNRVSYRELNSRVNKTANMLSTQGVVKGDRVGILLMNELCLVETVFATAKIGAITVALNWRLTADELEFILKDSGTTLLIYGAEFSDVVSELNSRGDATDIKTWIQSSANSPEFAQTYPELVNSAATDEPEINSGNDDLLFIMYTSGTTGLPKGVMHSHKTVMWSILTSTATTEYTSNERFLISLPLFHVGALSPLFTNMYSGLCSIIVRSFDPEQCWKLIADERITSTLLVPAMLIAMKAVFDSDRHNPSSLTTVVSGAAPVPVSLIQDYQELGVAINQVYGMTETCGPGCLIIGEDAITNAGSCGRPYLHGEARTVDDKGNDCPPNESGELWMRAPNNMVGYWNRPDATAETYVDGWLRTGDMATIDEDGFVTIVERLKDMLISGGENVYPAEIENVLLSHEGIADVAVIGIPSEKWGESAMAIVVKKGDALTEQDVIAITKGKLACYKSIKTAKFVEAIPRNPSGKILKRALREQFADVKAPE